MMPTFSCIRFSQNMAELKMFILCVMRRNKVVVCFLPTWLCDISRKPARGWVWIHRGKGFVSVLLSFIILLKGVMNWLEQWVVFTVPIYLWKHFILFFWDYFLCLCMFVFDFWCNTEQIIFSLILVEGCGFVKYSHRDMALAAINALDGVYTMRVWKKIFFSFQ